MSIGGAHQGGQSSGIAALPQSYLPGEGGDTQRADGGGTPRHSLGTGAIAVALQQLRPCQGKGTWLRYELKSVSGHDAGLCTAPKKVL